MCIRDRFSSLPDTDDVSHFVYDHSFEDALRFHGGNVIDVEPHGSYEADSSAITPDIGRTCRTQSSSSTVDFLQRRADQESAGRIFIVPTAGDMGDNLGPPA